MDRKERVREMILNSGADVCGIANIESFSDAPKGFHPSDIFTDCKSVVVFGLSLPGGLTKVDSRLIYAHFNEFSCSQADFIASKAVKRIEKEFGGNAVPLPSDDPYDFWDPEKMEGHGLLSIKHAAVAAGLGTLGKNTLLLNSQYGNWLTLGAVLTDLDLPSDPPAETICIPGCDLCIQELPRPGYQWNISGAEKVQASYLRHKCERIRYGKLQSMQNGLPNEVWKTVRFFSKMSRFS